MFDIMAKPVNGAFVVAPEKTKDFLNHQTNSEIRKRVIERGRKLQRQMEKCENERK